MSLKRIVKELKDCPNPYLMNNYFFYDPSQLYVNLKHVVALTAHVKDLVTEYTATLKSDCILELTKVEYDCLYIAMKLFRIGV